MITMSRRRMTALAAAIGALALVSALVVRTSSAVFTATASNDDNSFVAGDVVLTDGTGTIVFSVTDMEPGHTEQACVKVTYEGSIPDPGPVRMYSGGYTDVPGTEPGSKGLSTYLEITVDEGTGGGAGGSCAGFASNGTIQTPTTLAAFDAATDDYASGKGIWDPASTPETRTYRITTTFVDTVTNAEMNASTRDITFVWEVQTDGDA